MQRIQPINRPLYELTSGCTNPWIGRLRHTLDHDRGQTLPYENNRAFHNK